MWNQLTTQLKDVWSRLSTPQKGMLSVAASACLLAVLGTFYWATQPDYVTLASDLSPASAAEVMSQLESKNVEYELSVSGSTVMVPRSSLAQGRMAIKDIIDPAVSESSTGFAGMPGTPTEENDQRTRALQRDIARTLEQLTGIRSATVHISRPPVSPFVSERQPTTASVMLDLIPGEPWSGGTAQSVLMLVARSVEGLRPEDITLMDTKGRMFASSSGMSGHMSSQFEHQQMIEQSLSIKAETILADLLGPGKASVRVTADIDFRETTRTETIFDPDGKIKKEESIETVSQTGGVRPSGEVGFNPNLTSDPGSGDTLGDYKKEINSTEYDHPRIDETVKDSPGTIKRLSIAAIVDLTADEDPAAAAGNTGAAATPPALTEQDVEAIIKQAVGYDEARLDGFTVAFAPMKKIVPVAAPPSLVSTFQEYEGLVDRAILALGMALAAVLGFLALRRMKPVMVENTASDGLSPEQLTQILELSERVKGSPDAAAQILSVWMGEDDEAADETAVNNAA
ncbi:MAG: flagellar basal-body MS-ring/collar protein FliF [Planctomycetaceae bacterium]|nr:flagellar basal-body MS-ring/collar protein FliF [Planctomycetaceae bacterium]